jgi:transcriptional regulator with XRE-family HTH domain
MKFAIDQEWLNRRLENADDTEAAAGGTSFAELKKQVDRRMVTPCVIAAAQSELGKVVRFVREQKGITRRDLAEQTGLSEEEIEDVETRRDCTPSLRGIIYLADGLGLSRNRLKELAGYVTSRRVGTEQDSRQRFAANSKSVDTISDAEYEAIRALVEVLSQKQ